MSDNINLIELLKTYAEDNDVPIIEDEGLEKILEILKEKKPNKILEIGTAIGYSATKMHLETGASVFSIERNQKMYELAYFFLKTLNNMEEINLINADALVYEPNFKKEFDVIYIDAAKSQNIKFFEKYENYLKDDGIVIFDNLNFHGFVKMDPKQIKSKNLRQLVRKINEFLDYINSRKDYTFTKYDVGDGIGICKRSDFE